MKSLKVVLIIFLIGGMVLLSSCNNKSEPHNKKGDELIFSNDIVYSYDSNSKMTMKSFKGLHTITDLQNTFPIIAVRENASEYYTVYSLSENRLAYVWFKFSPDTGTTFFIKSIIEYPYTSVESEQKLSFLLEKDLPQNILN